MRDDVLVCHNFLLFPPVIFKIPSLNPNLKPCRHIPVINIESYLLIKIWNKNKVFSDHPPVDLELSLKENLYKNSEAVLILWTGLWGNSDLPRLWI